MERLPVNEDHFGHGIAESYDDDESSEFAPSVIEPIVSLLTELSSRGSALEFGIGTGRIALPLRERGVDVEGIDLSSAMLEQLMKKPGGDQVRTVTGDFTTTSMGRTYDLVYLIFNTIMNVTSQTEQVACFGNAAAHLAHEGRFLVEVAIPDIRRLPPGETIRPFRVEPDALGFDEYDVANQGLISHHYRLHGDRVIEHSVPFRFVWPAELDLMATMAGLTLRSRWSDWQRAPFTSESLKHVSVWEKTQLD